MSTVHCDACGTTLVATPAHAGLTVACSACGAHVQLSPAPPPRDDDEPPRRTWSGPPAAQGRRSEPVPDASPAPFGDVPAPMAPGSDLETTRALALSAASVLLPLLGPFALWYVLSAAGRLRERGGEEPTTLRHARVLAIVGTVLLGVLLVCGIPFVLVLG